VATLVIAIVGLGVDVVSWNRTDRATRQRPWQPKGYVDGSNGVTVTALNNQTCPDEQTDCVKVTADGHGAAVFLAGHRLPRTSAVEWGDGRRHPVTPILSSGAGQRRQTSYHSVAWFE
jgi:hypothetical protein